MKMLRRFAGRLMRASFPAAHSHRSFSQEGEDIALQRYLGLKKKGFYIDVGSHHPFRFSNTYLFYKKGWSGLCIDPLPGSARLFRKWRPRDIAVEMGVSDTPSTLRYFMFNEPALNTFDAGLAAERDGTDSYRICNRVDIMTDTLAEIIRKHIPPSVTDIDFMSVDVEGLDLQVLQSNDWSLYRPRAVIAECLKSDLSALPDDEVTKFLSGVGYRPYAKTGHSVIFVERAD